MASFSQCSHALDLLIMLISYLTALLRNFELEKAQPFPARMLVSCLLGHLGFGEAPDLHPLTQLLG
jgi:hypothetical protein